MRLSTLVNIIKIILSTGMSRDLSQVILDSVKLIISQHNQSFKYLIFYSENIWNLLFMSIKYTAVFLKKPVTIAVH